MRIPINKHSWFVHGVTFIVPTFITYKNWLFSPILVYEFTMAMLEQRQYLDFRLNFEYSLTILRIIETFCVLSFTGISLYKYNTIEVGFGIFHTVCMLLNSRCAFNRLRFFKDRNWNKKLQFKEYDL